MTLSWGEHRPIVLDRLDQSVVHGADPPDAACVLVFHDPIGTLRLPLRQDAGEIRVSERDEVVECADADAGAHGLQLTDRARALEGDQSAAEEFRHIAQCGGVVEIVDVSDEAMGGEPRHVGRRGMPGEIGGRGEEAQRIAGQLAGDEAPRLRLLQRDGDVDLPATDGPGLGRRHELDGDGRVALGQGGEAFGQVGGREPVRRPDPHRAGEFDVAVAEFGQRLQECGFHPLRGSEETTAGLRQRHARGAAVEQAGIQGRSRAVTRRAAVAWSSFSARAPARNWPARATARNTRTSSQFTAAPERPSPHSRCANDALAAQIDRLIVRVSQRRTGRTG